MGPGNSFVMPNIAGASAEGGIPPLGEGPQKGRSLLSKTLESRFGFDVLATLHYCGVCFWPTFEYSGLSFWLPPEV